MGEGKRGPGALIVTGVGVRGGWTEMGSGRTPRRGGRLQAPGDQGGTWHLLLVTACVWGIRAVPRSRIAQALRVRCTWLCTTNLCYQQGGLFQHVLSLCLSTPYTVTVTVSGTAKPCNPQGSQRPEAHGGTGTKPSLAKIRSMTLALSVCLP